MFNLFKKKPQKEYKPIPRIDYEYFDFEYENSDAESKYLKKTDELELNDDYDMSKKEMLEEFIYEDKVYRYLPTEFDAYLKDGLIYDLDGTEIGKVKDEDIGYLTDYDKLEIVFYHGKHKFIDFDDETVYVEKGFNYFRYRIKKVVQ